MAQSQVLSLKAAPCRARRPTRLMKSFSCSSPLMALDGVQKVLPDVNAKRVHVHHDPNQASEERLRDRLKKLGYA